MQVSEEPPFKTPKKVAELISSSSSSINKFSFVGLFVDSLIVTLPVLHAWFLWLVAGQLARIRRVQERRIPWYSGARSQYLCHIRAFQFRRIRANPVGETFETISVCEKHFIGFFFFPLYSDCQIICPDTMWIRWKSDSGRQNEPSPPILSSFLQFEHHRTFFIHTVIQIHFVMLIADRFQVKIFQHWPHFQ